MSMVSQDPASVSSGGTRLTLANGPWRTPAAVQVEAQMVFRTTASLVCPTRKTQPSRNGLMYGAQRDAAGVSCTPRAAPPKQPTSSHKRAQAPTSGRQFPLAGVAGANARPRAAAAIRRRQHAHAAWLSTKIVRHGQRFRV
eukprot:350597-Chlamydomonas_euryale.AAC.7